jgi:hypothetical protein
MLGNAPWALINRPLLRLWREKRGEAEPEDLRPRDRALFRVFGRFLEAHTRPSAVLVDELDAGTLQRGLNFRAGTTSATQGAIVCFKSFNGRDRDIGRASQLLLGPSQERPRSLNLPN